jgi:hypothetical protein
MQLHIFSGMQTDVVDGIDHLALGIMCWWDHMNVLSSYKYTVVTTTCAEEQSRKSMAVVRRSQIPTKKSSRQQKKIYISALHSKKKRTVQTDNFRNSGEGNLSDPETFYNRKRWPLRIHTSEMKKKKNRKIRSPIFPLGSNAELFDLTLDGGERFGCYAEIEQLGFDELIQVLDWLGLAQY